MGIKNQKLQHLMCNPMSSMQQRGRVMPGGIQSTYIQAAIKQLEPKMLEEIKELQIKTSNIGKLDLSQQGLT